MDIVNIVEETVIPNLVAYIKKNKLQLEDKYTEEKAFFYKIIGDYYRYAVEATTVSIEIMASGGVNQKKEFFKKGAMEAYQTCTKIVKRLKPYNTVRLGLALNFSVF